jgi:antitoxin Phd
LVASSRWFPGAFLLTSHMTSYMIAGGGKLREADMGSWQVQDAKARFSEFLDATISKGPQVVTRRGIETAVLVPIEEWHRLQRAARPSLKALLLAPEARCENLLPQRRKLRRRNVVELK